MTTATATLEAFRYWRQRASALTGAAPYLAASEALQRARAEVAEGKPRRYTGRQSTGPGFARRVEALAPYPAPKPNARVYFDSLDEAPARFVGYADEIARAQGSRRIDHNGWYNRAADESGYRIEDSVYRGVVFQLPAGADGSRFVAGYQDADGRLALDMAHVETGPKGGADRANFDEAALEAASQADRIAEIEAKEARDYDEAWQAGASWADLGEQVAADRKAALAILRERKALTGVEAPAARAAVCDRLAQYLESIGEARAKRAKLARECWARLADAFNEGAGATVI